MRDFSPLYVRVKLGHPAMSAQCPVCQKADTAMSTRPSVTGRCQVSPSDRHAAELTLLSVVGAEAATLCC